MKPISALTIAGSDSGGGAGIQADLKTFSALEAHGFCVITSVTAQNTQKVQGVSDIPPDFVSAQIDAIMDDFEVKWAKTGMVSRSEIIRNIRKKANEHNLNLIVDPVMKAASGSSLLEKKAINDLKDLIGQAFLVTPNIDEASELADINIESIEDAKTAAEKIAMIGPDNVLIKGGHLDEPKIHNILLHENDFLEYETDRVPVNNVHGTGCVFSSAITAELAKNKDVKTAIKTASDFMVDAIEQRLNIGSGPESANPMARIWKITTNGEETNEVQKAAKKLTKHEEFARLIPEVGINIAMAPKNAQKREDVIGLTGRIIKVANKPYLSGIPAPGGSEHIANLVLSTMKHDPEYRAAMNIRYSDRIITKSKDLGFEISSFNRNNEPLDVKTMGWGADQAIEKHEKIPDIIYDEGAIGKEPMIRILGKTATEVSEKALGVLKELEK